ncbi:hypothetical protein ACFYP4_02765 [Streptomyces sp. NPDC005551]|uniref:hypothetical protein n=1 Tax=Streptomyces sp. NPDC005551 TaxID=3364725 RepID=UPI0036A3FFCF
MTDPDLELLVLKRQLAWDMVQHADLFDPEKQERIGLRPASPEVLHREHEDAHIRFAQVLPCYDRVMTLSGVAALLARETVRDLGDESHDDDERNALAGALFTCVTTAVISDLIDKGYLTPHQEHYYA